MIDVKLALRLPFSNLKKFFLGLVFFHPLLEPLFGYPYGLICAKYAYEGHKKMPDWNFKNIFFIGLKVIAIAFIYFLLLGIALWLLAMQLGIDFGSGETLLVFPHAITAVFLDKIEISDSQTIYSTVYKQNVVGLIVVALFGFFLNLYLYCAKLLFVLNDNFEKAFAFKEILTLSLNKKIFFIWLLFLPFDVVLLFLKRGLFPILWVKAALGTIVGIPWWLFMVYGFVPALFYYMYAVIFNNLQGQAVKEMRYKAPEKSAKE